MKQLPDQQKVMEAMVASMTDEERQAVLQRYNTEIGVEFPFSTLEELVTSPDGFDLVTATSLQLAILRALEGRPLGKLKHLKVVQRAFGTDKIPDFDAPPPEFAIIAAVRCGKSTFAAACGVHASQNIDVSPCSRGEIPRYSILSIERDNAMQTYAHLVAALQQPTLSPLRITEASMTNRWTELIDDTGIETVGNVFLWHPNERPVEIRVVAGKRAGGSLVSRWSAGVCFEEATRMLGIEEGVINYTDSKRAVRTRLLPGAQLFSIGSPWRAQGPIYELHLKHFGAPTKKRVVVKANGPSMNPSWWTTERCAEIRVEDPEAYKTDVKAEFLEPVEALINPVTVNRCIRESPHHLEFQKGHSYSARIDPATRGNGWTFIIGDRQGRKKRTCYNQEWRGTTLDPLQPRDVLIDIGRKLKEYELTFVYTDIWSVDALRNLAEDLIDPVTKENISFDVIEDGWTPNEKKSAYLLFRDACGDGQIELTNDPLLLADIRMIQKRRTGDSFTINLPKTGDGRHCDNAPSVVGLFRQWLEEDIEQPPDKDDEKYEAYVEQQMEQEELDEFEEGKTRTPSQFDYLFMHEEFFDGEAQGF